MKKKIAKAIFACTNCGSSFSKWQGQCSACLEWNSLVEEIISVTENKNRLKPLTAPSLLNEVQAIDTLRFKTGLVEFDKVLGGGLVLGSLVLIGGQPGVGKSTLLLQITKAFDQENINCLYVSGEESEAQVKYRALRMGVNGEKLWLYSQTSLEIILDFCHKLKPKVLILDSIQTIKTEDLQSVPGSIAQIRECTHRILNYAKSNNLTVLIVGHITKDGELAGPKLLEHMVDTVLQFEGDKQHYFRILRAIKNRFGPTDEVSVFEMKEMGLVSVLNPATYFLADVAMGAGSIITVLLEGNQPFLVEVQALLSDNHFTYPRRTALGLDLNRLHLLLAVLERHAGILLGQYDVCVSLAGGIKSTDPALDLAICVAIYASFREMALGKGVIFLGEVGLGGEIRLPSRLEQRVKTAIRQGFNKIVIPKRAIKSLNSKDVKLYGYQTIKEVLSMLNELG